MNGINLTKLEELDFEIGQEEWNKYELQDRTKLRIRAILLKLYRAPASPEQTGFITNFQNILSVIVDPNLRGLASTKILSPEEINAANKHEVRFTPIVEPWNNYRLPNGDQLKTKLVVSLVYRIDGHYDIFGNPLYVVQSKTVLQPIPRNTPLGIETH